MICKLREGTRRRRRRLSRSRSSSHCEGPEVVWREEAVRLSRAGGRAGAGQQDPLLLLRRRRAPRRVPSRGGTQSDLRFHRTCRGRDKSRKNRGGPAAVSPLFADHAPPLLYSCRGSPLPLERAGAPQPGVQGSRYAGWPPPSSPPLSPAASLDMRPPLFHELCLLLPLWSLSQEHSSCPRFVRQLTGGSVPPTPANSQLGFRKARGGEEVLAPRGGVGWGAQTLSPSFSHTPQSSAS